MMKFHPANNDNSFPLFLGDMCKKFDVFTPLLTTKEKRT